MRLVFPRIVKKLSQSICFPGIILFTSLTNFHKAQIYFWCNHYWFDEQFRALEKSFYYYSGLQFYKMSIKENGMRLTLYQTTNF